MDSGFKDEVLVSEIVPDNHTTYARYAIKEFLPDNIDGMKLLYRRILWTLGSNASKQKCIKLISNTMEQLHPHGDLSIYSGLIRLCQPFSNALPLINGLGNVGSYGGARPAAPRYLDLERSEFAVDLFFTRVNTKTFKYIPDELNLGMEPAYFIPIIPTALLMGVNSIGVGFRSSIPFYNFVNICDLTIAYIQYRKDVMFHPKDYYSTFAKYLIPDFPHWLLIRNGEEVLDHYSKGDFNQSIVMDGCMDVFPNKINLKSIPYGQKFQEVLDRLKDLMNRPSFVSANTNTVDNLMAAVDVGDIKITFKRGVDVFEILDQYKRDLGFTKPYTPIWNFTDYEGTVIALTPFQLIEKWYIERYRSVLGDLKITQRELNIQKREIEAKVIVVDNTDKVTDIVKTSSDKNDAIIKLVTAFKEQRLSPLQAEYILSLSLAQLTRDGKDKLLLDLANVTRKIKEHTEKFKDVDHIIISDIEWIRDKYASKITRRCALPDYIGCLHINKNGIVQIRSVQELAHQLTRWGNEQVSVELYPAGKNHHVKYLDNKGYLEYPMCFPKVFKAHDMKTLKYKPRATVIINDGQLYRLDSMVRPSKGQYAPVGDGFMSVTAKGVIESHVLSDAPKRQQINALGIKSDIQFISPIISDEVVVAYYDNRESNLIHIGKFKIGDKLPLNVLSKPIVAGMWRVNDQIALTIADKYLNRCATKHLYFKDIEQLLDGNKHVIIYLNKRTTSNKKNLVQVIKGRELYGIQHITKIKNDYEFI